MGELKPISTPISPILEMTEVCDRTLRAGGPALLFNNPTGYDMPVLGNLFGTTRRVALGMGAEDVSELRKIGHVLARLKEPEPPKDFKDLLGLGSLVKSVWDMSPKELRGAKCQEIVWEGNDVDLARLPIQHCWPGDIAPLITWGLVITKGPNKKRQNLGIYRQQVLGRNKVIMRWLAHRGGALDFREHAIQSKGKPYPIAVALGADPATILGAVTPVPDSLSEYQFAGLLRGSRTELVKAIGSELRVPASAEIVLEGHIYPDENHPSGYEHALEGPYGDHTGYYNEQDSFPVFTIDRITMRRDPIYHSTYTGKPPDEPAVLGLALNEVFVPLLQKQFSEITDFLSAARRLQLPHGRGADQEAVRGPRQARDVRRVELPAPVHVYQVHRGGRRRREYPRLERSHLGHHHARRPHPRYHPGRQHAHRLPGLRLAGQRPGQQDGHRCDE